MAAKRSNTAAKAQDGDKKPKAKAKAKATTTTPKRPDKHKVREQMEAAVLKNGKAVIEAVIKEAQKGGYLPAKYLFEFAGISEPLPETTAPAAPQVGALMDILLGAATTQGGEGEKAFTPTNGKSAPAGGPGAEQTSGG
jgi:hypothetical protein